MDNAAATLRPAAGTVEIDVDEIKNTGKFEARLKIPEGDLIVAFDRFREFEGKSCRVEKSTRLTADRLLYSQSTTEPEESPESRGLHALFRHGSELEVKTWEGSDPTV